MNLETGLVNDEVFNIRPLGPEATNIYVPTEGLNTTGVRVGLDLDRLTMDLMDQIERRGITIPQSNAEHTIDLLSSTKDITIQGLKGSGTSILGGVLVGEGIPRILFLKVADIVNDSVGLGGDEETILRRIDYVLNAVWVHEREHLIQMLSIKRMEELYEVKRKLLVERSALASAITFLAAAAYSYSNLINSAYPQIKTPIYTLLTALAIYRLDKEYRKYYRRHKDPFEIEAREAAIMLDVLPNIFDVTPEYK